MLDYQVESGTLTFGTVEKLLIDFPQDSDFLHANLCPDDLNDAIQSVES